MDKFSIVSIPQHAREDTEQLGSKPKFWVLLDGHRWLFKEARPNTGEDWAEKAVAEIAREIGINAATVELAEYAGKVGCISRNFIDVQAGEALVHGNEIMAWKVSGYDKEKIFRQADHTLENIQQAIRGLFDLAHTDSVLTELAGYMVLDALIGNTDRHHENWGLRSYRQTVTHSGHHIDQVTGQRLHSHTISHSQALSVAPSFDHASSLGRELLDERRAELLATNRVAWYISKGRGGIFRDAQQRHGENPLRLVEVAARAYPSYFRSALEQVAAFDVKVLHEILTALPKERASDLAKEFAEAMVLNARTSLIELLK